ncbi:MAG TPA: 30S ribosomal protein S3 [Gammaproteobacteria bacterium]|nr:30S ribosomal protein S3 [Gammaproteobacteria bacterium]
MGQKVHPIGIRLGISTDWNSKWYADSKEYPNLLNADIKVREFLKKKLANANVSRIQIERPTRALIVTVHTARPGVVIGKKGADIEKLRQDVAKIAGLHINNVKINIEEIRKPEMDAQLVAESIAQQLERRVMFRRAMKRSIQNTMRMGGQGIKINVGGRLNGAEIARSECYMEGRVPLHTLRADIDYGFAEALTTYGILGVKVWIYKGEVFDLEEKRTASSDAKGKKTGGKA